MFEGRPDQRSPYRAVVTLLGIVGRRNAGGFGHLCGGVRGLSLAGLSERFYPFGYVGHAITVVHQNGWMLHMVIADSKR